MDRLSFLHHLRAVARYCGGFVRSEERLEDRWEDQGSLSDKLIDTCIY